MALIIYAALLVVMLVGVIGSFIPGLPGSSLILGAIAVWGIFNGFNTVGWALGVAIVVLLLSIATDAIASYVGAKQAGASNWGQIGAMVGLVLGFLGLLPALPVGGPLVGMLFGPLLGAFVGELIYRKDLKLRPRVRVAFKAGIGIIVGSLVGNLIEGFLAIASVIVFLFTTWPPVPSI